MLRIFIVIAILIFATPMTSLAASASGWDSGNTIGVVINTSQGQSSNDSSNGSIKSQSNGCVWQLASQNVMAFFKLKALSNDGHWDMVFCPNPSSLPALSQYVIQVAITTAVVDFVWVKSNSSNNISGYYVALEAEKYVKLNIPEITFDPTIGVVNLKELLGINPVSISQKSVSLSISGISATVVASPSYANFLLGDGSLLTCDINSVVLAYEGMILNGCGYIYKASSLQSSFLKNNVPAYQVIGCVIYSVTFTSSDHQSGDLKPLKICNTDYLNVSQIQSVLVGP